MRTKRGFMPKYGSGEIPMRLNDFLFSADTGNIKLVFDNGEIIEFNHVHNISNIEDEIREKYGDYGVKNISHKFTCVQVGIAELAEEEKKYI